MNAQALTIMIVMPTHCVPTRKGRMSVVALVDIRVMVKTAQVILIIWFLRLSAPREKVFF